MPAKAQDRANFCVCSPEEATYPSGFMTVVVAAGPGTA